MPEVTINYLAVLMAAVSYMAVGFVWYSMPVFGKRWMKLTGLSQDDVKNGPGMGYALTMLGALLGAYVLSYFVDWAGAETLSEGLQVGFLAALGFIIPSFGADFIFNRKPRDLYLITVGYHTVTLMVAAAILAVWQ